MEELERNNLQLFKNIIIYYMAKFRMAGIKHHYIYLTACYVLGILLSISVTKLSKSKNTSSLSAIDSVELGFSKASDIGSDGKEMSDWINSLSPNSYSQAIAILTTRRKDSEGTHVQELLFRWFELDPRQAVEHAYRFRTQGIGEKFWKTLLHKWCEKSDKEAENWVDSRSSGAWRRDANQVICEIIGVNDPHRALLRLVTNEVIKSEWGLIADLYNKFLSENLCDGIAFAINCKHSAVKMHLLSELLKTTVKLSDEEREKILNQLPETFRTSNSAQLMLNGWISSNPNEALDYANNLNISKFRTNALQRGLSEIVIRNFAEGAKEFEKLDPADQTMLIGSVVKAGLKYHNFETMVYLKGIKDPEIKSKAYIEAIRSISKDDTKSATSLLEYMASDADRGTSIGILGAEIAKKSFNDAVNFCLAAAPIKENAFEHPQLVALVTGWAKTDPIAAIEWIGRLPDSAAKSNLFFEATGAQNSIGSKEILETAKNFSSSTYAEVSGRQIERWLNQDSTAALSWAKGLQEGEVKSAAFLAAGNYMATNRASELDSWLHTLNEEARDAAIIGITPNIIDYHSALNLVAKVNDPRVRALEAQRVWEAWKTINPTEAKSWMLSPSVLSNEIRKIENGN